MWHWSQRADCTPTNLSMSYWQTSRVFALLGQVENARRFAQRCLQVSQSEGIEPVYLGYAYEALARAEMVAGDREKMREYLEKGREIAEPDGRRGGKGDAAKGFRDHCLN